MFAVCIVSITQGVSGKPAGEDACRTLLHLLFHFQNSPHGELSVRSKKNSFNYLQAIIASYCWTHWPGVGVSVGAGVGAGDSLLHVKTNKEKVGASIASRTLFCRAFRGILEQDCLIMMTVQAQFPARGPNHITNGKKENNLDRLYPCKTRII